MVTEESNRTRIWGFTIVSKTEGPQRPCRRGGRNRNLMALPEHGVHPTDRNGPTSRGAIFTKARDDQSGTAGADMFEEIQMSTVALDGAESDLKKVVSM